MNLNLRQFLNGLIHYWPLDNDLKDYIGSADMTAGGPISYANDRLNNSNKAIYLDSSYCQLPNQTYFYEKFTLTAWAKLISDNWWSRLIDCSTDLTSTNVIVNFNVKIERMLSFRIASGFTTDFTINATMKASLNDWMHIGAVLDGDSAYFYLNGILQGSQVLDGYALNTFYGANCFIGRSKWNPFEADADAVMDEIYIYNRALSQSEILDNMNFDSSFFNI